VVVLNPHLDGEADDVPNLVMQGENGAPMQPGPQPVAQVFGTRLQGGLQLADNWCHWRGRDRVPYPPVSVRPVGQWRVHYPRKFKILFFMTVLGAGLQAIELNLRLLPSGHPDYKFNCQAVYELVLRFMRLSWLLLAVSLVFRVPLLLQAFSMRAADLLAGIYGHGFMAAFLVILNGPVYVATILSGVNWCRLSVSGRRRLCESSFEATIDNQEIYVQGLLSCTVTATFVALIHWQNALLRLASEQPPPNLIHWIPTRCFDPGLCGAGEGKAYSAECPICLDEFHDKEKIKVTVCGHAFHEQCLNGWVSTKPTCAVCRRDVVSGKSRAVPMVQV
jgi:hypothetical protein